jgi:hypothetical protein
MRMRVPPQLLTLILTLAFASGVRAAGWSAPLQDDPVEPLNGLLASEPPVTAAVAREQCLDLPGDGTEGILGPHGDTLLTSHCEVIAFAVAADRRWTVVRYARTMVFTPEDQSRGADARDSVSQEEVVLLETLPDRRLMPTWHHRFDTTPYALWRSVTPEVAAMPRGAVLLSIMSCVNGTGGCDQAFLHRLPDGRWSAVTQAWRQKLSSGVAARIRHGVRIEPATLHGSAGFYGDGDPNCCPSQVLEFDLLLRDGALVLRRQPRIVPAPGPTSP